MMNLFSTQESIYLAIFKVQKSNPLVKEQREREHNKNNSMKKYHKKDTMHLVYLLYTTSTSNRDSNRYHKWIEHNEATFIPSGFYIRQERKKGKYVTCPSHPHRRTKISKKISKEKKKKSIYLLIPSINGNAHRFLWVRARANDPHTYSTTTVHRLENNISYLFLSLSP